VKRAIESENARKNHKIQAEAGVHRDTVAGYDPDRQQNPAKTFPGSDTRRRFAAAVHRDAIS